MVQPLLLLFLFFSSYPPPAVEDTTTVGKWKLERKIPLDGPNRCYVDELTFFDATSFELIFKTIINQEEVVYTYSGEIEQEGQTTFLLGDKLAKLVDFKKRGETVSFHFEYGENLGMFCTRKNHPYPHKHLPHDIQGRKIKP